MKALKWVLVLPVFIAVYAATYTLAWAFEALGGFLNGEMSDMDKIWWRAFALFAGGWAGIFCGAHIAPSYNSKVAVILTVLVGGLMLFCTYVSIFIEKEHFKIIEYAALLIGAILGCKRVVSKDDIF